LGEQWQHRDDRITVAVTASGSSVTDLFGVGPAAAASALAVHHRQSGLATSTQRLP
jgi:hypothetical protein